MWANRKIVYQRFESRVRVASRAGTLSEFVAILSRKCGVQVPAVGASLLADLHVEASVATEALSLARRQSGLVVALMRLQKEAVRARNEELAL